MFRAAAYVFSKDIFGNRIGADTIPRIVQYMNIEETLIVLGKALWLIEDDRLQDASTQLLLANQFLPEIRQDICRELVLDGRILFFPSQIRCLMKLIFLHCKVAVSESPLENNDLYKIGLALFATSDFLGKEYRRWNEMFRIDDEDSFTFMIHQLIGTSYLIRLSNSTYSITRSKIIFNDIHHEINSENESDYVEIDEVFKSATGINLLTYIHIGMGIITYFLEYRGMDSTPKDGNFILLDPDNWFDSTKVEKNLVMTVFKLIAVSIDEYRNEIQKHNQREIGHDFILMRQRPLLNINNRGYLPFSFEYLVERLSIGIYWIIFDYLREFNNNTHLKFSRYVGKLFQEYVNKLINIINNRQEKKEKLILDSKYFIGNNEYRTPDIILIGENYVILIEVSSTRLQAKRTTALGIPQAFEDDIDKMILHNARSLDTFISNFKTHPNILQNIDCSSIKKFYPIIVTIEGFPRFQIISTYIQNRIEEQQLLMDDNIAPLSFLDIDDLEYLEVFCSKRLILLLESWHNSQDFGSFTFTHFLKDELDCFDIDRSSYMFTASQALTKDASMLLFNLNDMEDFTSAADY